MKTPESMSPHVEYRPCSRLPADRYHFGKDGTAWRRNSRWKKDVWRKLKPFRTRENMRGDALVIRVEINEKPVTFCLGALILSAFGQPRPLGFRANNINGDKNDCRLSNLEWRRIGHKLSGKIGIRGERAAGAKLTEDKVKEMRVKYAYGATTEELAEEYGVSRSNANRAICGKNWGHVPGAVSMRGRLTWGSGQGGSKLDEIDVSEIKQLIRDGFTGVEIARMYEVSPSAICLIRKDKRWIHVPEPTGATV